MLGEGLQAKAAHIAGIGDFGVAVCMQHIAPRCRVLRFQAHVSAQLEVRSVTQMHKWH